MNRRENSIKHHSRRIATCSVLCAVAVVIIFFGTVIEVLDLTSAAVASLFLLPILLCYGTRYALLSYGVTAVLSVIFMPQSLASWMFVGLVGYYPVVKQKLDQLPRLLRWLVKLLLPCVIMVLYLMAFHFIIRGGEGGLLDSFLLGFGETGESPVLAWIIAGCSVVTFGMFDLLISRILILYRLKWGRRIEKWMKP